MKGHHVRCMTHSDVSFDPKDLLMAGYSFNILTGKKKGFMGVG